MRISYKNLKVFCMRFLFTAYNRVTETLNNFYQQLLFMSYSYGNVNCTLLNYYALRFLNKNLRGIPYLDCKNEKRFSYNP